MRRVLRATFLKSKSSDGEGGSFFHAILPYDRESYSKIRGTASERVAAFESAEHLHNNLAVSVSQRSYVYTVKMAT